MTFSELDVDIFYRLETSLHRHDTRSSRQEVAELLADSFLEFGKSGRVYNKQVTIDALANENSSGSNILPQVADFSVAALSDEVVLVTYRSIRAVSDAGRNFETLRSSIWKMHAGRWQMVFHQGTPIPNE